MVKHKKLKVKPDKFLRSLNRACENIKYRKAKPKIYRRSLSILRGHLNSPRGLEAKLVVARYFNISAEKLLEPTAPRKNSPEYMAILRSGFDDGAAVPGSSIRKVTR